jgi:hypothetical protein
VDLLAHSPPSLPIVVYYRNPDPLDDKDEPLEDQDLDEPLDDQNEPLDEPLDDQDEPLDNQGSVKDIVLALQHPERVCRINLQLLSASMREVFKSMRGPFPMLETLQLYCSSFRNKNATLPTTFEAPNLRHLQLSDFTFVPRRLFPLTTTICPSSLVTFSLGEITPVKYKSPAVFAECLAIMPQLKCLKIGYLFSVNGIRHEDGSNREASHSRVVLANLEEFQFKGGSSYLEALSARIEAPSLRKLSITTDAFTHIEFPFLLELISGAADLSFQFARLRFKHNLSLVMDHEELWTGNGAFKLISSGKTLQDTQVLGMLGFKLSAIKSLLIEYPHQRRKADVDRAGWHRVLRLFGDLEILRVANESVHQLESALRPGANDEESAGILLPKLRKIVCYGSKKNFKDFVASRRRAGMDVEVEMGPSNRL